MYISSEMIDHFICFITSQHIVQDLPIGQKHLSLSSGQVLEVPNVIRALIPEHNYSTTTPRVLQGIRHNLLEAKIFASNS